MPSVETLLLTPPEPSIRHDLSEVDLRISHAALSIKEEIERIGVDLDHLYHPSDRMIQRIATAKGVEFVGAGREVFVLSAYAPAEREKVFAFNYNWGSSDLVMSQYYSQQILSTLFPHNFPCFYDWIDVQKPNPRWNGDHIYGTVRERVYGKFRRKKLWQGEKNFRSLDRDSLYPFSNVVSVMADLHLPYEFVDTGGQNFILRRDGGVCYIDTLHLSRGFWNTKNISLYMQKNNFSDSQIKKVQNSIQSLI